jgi:mannose-6-phosphate isomerase-like protein (cupin superfamily)
MGGSLAGADTSAVQRKTLRFGEGFRIALRNRRAEAAVMVIAPGDAEGDPGNRHRGADQWLYVVAGRGTAIVNGRRYRLGERSLLLIERGDRHEIRASGDAPLRTLNVYVPPAYTKAGDTLPPGRRGRSG